MERDVTARISPFPGIWECDLVSGKINKYGREVKSVILDLGYVVEIPALPFSS
jgi:hypothetical protein